jgi:succinyl-diaminopimelate desuccinylase
MQHRKNVRAGKAERGGAGGIGSGNGAHVRDATERPHVAQRRGRLIVSRRELSMPSEALADLLETMVNIPSVTGGEAAIAGWVEDRLRKLPHGQVLRSGHSVVWRGPERGRPALVLAGHLDTVPGDGIPARRENGRLHGLGSSDMKAGDAVILALVERLDPERLRFDLTAVFYEAEEGPLEANGLRRLLAEMPWLRKARLAVLLEPTDLRVELGCIGSMNAEVRVSGKRAHSARPWLGVNAVERAVPWLAEITRFPVTPSLVQGIEYKETLQVTTLRAGTARNVVPDELVANLNYRFPPDRDLGAAERRLRALVPAEFDFRVVDSSPPGRVCLDEPEVQGFVSRHKLEVAGKQGWTDVAQFTQAGIPAFNFGPGVPEQAHQTHEFCPISNLEPACRYLAAWLESRA